MKPAKSCWNFSPIISKFLKSFFFACSKMFPNRNCKPGSSKLLYTFPPASSKFWVKQVRDVVDINWWSFWWCETQVQHNQRNLTPRTRTMFWVLTRFSRLDIISFILWVRQKFIHSIGWHYSRQSKSKTQEPPNTGHYQIFANN
jgi:hypothetical protein